jgi:hypothetical protein
VASISIIETKKVEIPAIKIPAWLVLLIGVSLLSLTVKGFESFQEATFNSAFERNTRGWTAYKGNLYSVDGGQSGNCLKIIASDDAIGYAYYAFPTDVGNMYKVTAYFKRGTAGNGQIKVGTSIDDTNLYYSGVLSDANWKQYSSTFRAITPTTYITLVNLTSIKGQTSFFDTITINRIEDYYK